MSMATMYVFHEILLIVGVTILLFSSSTESGIPRDRAISAIEISEKCYLCMGNEKRENNVEACSIKNNLEIENCPIEAFFDKCMVFQAFSKTLNTTIFKRECTSERYCSKEMVCSDPDHLDCIFKCCAGDLCNDFDFKNDSVSPPATQPTEQATTKENQGGPARPEAKSPSPTKSSRTTFGIKGINPTPEISKNCYLCIGDEEGHNNSAACSMKNKLEIEKCSAADHLDRCIIFQAFSASSNTTIFKRECTSEIFCTQAMACVDPDYVDCRFECCTGDLCNDYDFKVLSRTTRETVAVTTQEETTEVTTKPEATKAPPEATKAPPEATKAPPEATKAPPETTKAPPETTKAPPEATKAPPETTKAPPEATKAPPEATKAPPEATKAPPEATKAPPETTKPQTTPTTETTSSSFNEITTIRRKLTTIPTENPVECRDIDKMCKTYTSNPVHLTYYCEDEKYYMIEYCRKTCNFCDEDPVTTQPALQPTTQIIDPQGVMTKTMSTPSSESCQDKREECPELANKMNYCRLQYLFMEAFCRKSCGWCSNTESLLTPKVPGPAPTSKATTAPAGTTPATKPTTGSDVGVAGPRATEKPRTDCRDRREQCSRYANYPAYCQYTKQFMIKNCPKSCGFCSEENGGQHGIPNPTVTESVLPQTTGESEGQQVISNTKPTVTESVPSHGHDLRWIVQPWGKCVSGKQSRLVHCHHFYDGVMYTVIIKECIKFVAEMPAKQRSC